MALTPLPPLPPPAMLECGGHILLNAYMHAMHVEPSPILPGTYSVIIMAAPVAMVRGPTHESDCKVDTVKIEGSIPMISDFSHSRPRPMQEGKFCLLDTDVTFTFVSQHLTAS